MKRLLVALAILVFAGAANAATLVLKGGKRLEGVSLQQKGGYFIVTHASGKVESYPLAAVDVAGTREANNIVDAKPTPKAPEEPHSPFLQAVASEGSAAARVTDADVAHPAPVPAGETQESEGADTAAQIVLVSADRRDLGEGRWEITSVVANQGKEPASAVLVMARLLDAEGKTVGSGSGSFPGKLEPGTQATITVAITATGMPAQISTELQWQTLRPVTVTETPVPTPAAPKPLRGGPDRAKAAPDQPPTYSVPAGSSPNALPSNPNALPPVTTVPQAPQVPPRQPSGSKG